MKYINGDWYRGEWKKNMYDGYGTFIIKDQSEYVGYFKDHQRNGNGVEINQSGEVIEGNWVNGEHCN
jgi:hypothetical protein